MIARFVITRDAKDAPYLLHSVSIPNWVPTTALKWKTKLAQSDGTELEISAAEWAHGAAALSANGKLLYMKSDLLGDLPGTLQQMVARESAAIISSYDALVGLWERQHQEWLKRKQEWESDAEHQKYLTLRPRFEKFESEAGGRTGKRRGRWHKYLDWLRDNPDLASWSGGPPGVIELLPGAAERIRKTRPRWQRSVEAEEFWKANPALAALDKLHGYYEREFVRRRKAKKHPDGFDHRPTFTLPDAIRHPRWFVFNAPQTSPPGYRNLCLPTRPGASGGVELLLVSSDSNSSPCAAAWVPVSFTADPRLADFRRVQIRREVRKGKEKGTEKEGSAFLFCDRQINLERPSQISGIKLVFRQIRTNADGSLASAVPYLVFTCTIEDVPLTEAAKAVKWVDVGEKRKRASIPQDLVVCAVDLGIRNIGFATLAVRDESNSSGVRVLRSRNIWTGREEQGGAHPGRWSSGPELRHLAKHKHNLRRLRGLRGKPIGGEASHIELQAHITHMADDRFKKAARAIVNFALNVEARTDSRGEPYPRADVLLLEDLVGLLPDAERERGINSALIEFNRGHLVERLREVAKDCGVKLLTVSPVGTSQVCSRCGALGRRYSITRNAESREADIHFGFVEKLFACPECKYRANADHNASVNVHRRFFLGERAVERYREWQLGGPRARAESVKTIESRMVDDLRRTHCLRIADMPF